MNKRTLCILTLLLVSGCDQDIPISDRLVPAKMATAAREGNRQLVFDGTQNFRELGGIKANDGRSLRWGKLYRSSQLSRLSETDQLFLEELEIRHIVDFRLDYELASDGLDKIRPDSGIQHTRIPIGTREGVDNISDRILSGKFDEDEARQLLKFQNRVFIKDFTPAFSEWMHLLLNRESYPMVFHCTGGKDRTGLAAALLLLTLDVPMQRVMEDYLDTNRFTDDWIDDQIRTMKLVGTVGKMNLDALKILYGVEQQFIEAAFKVIRDDYGSIDNYIEQALEIDAQEKETLKNMLLEYPS